MQAEPDPSSSVATCAMVLQPGYRLAAGTSGGRVLRPARVSVAEAGAAGPSAAEPADADRHGETGSAPAGS